LNLVGGAAFEEIDRRLLQLALARPRAALPAILAALVPLAVGEAVLDQLAIDRNVAAAHLARDDRRRLAHALAAWPAPVAGSRGYNFAEATAGGVSLRDINPTTMESRVCPGLFLVGEMLDVDGRLGGFNFQWAWSSAYVAARGLALLHSA